MSRILHPTRRHALQLGLGTAIGIALGQKAGAQEAQAPDGAAPPPPPGLDLQNFSFDALSAAMRDKAARPFEPPADDLPQLVRDLDYDSYRRILYRRERTVWAQEPGQFHLQAYFPGFLYQATTRLYSGDGQSFRPLAFTPADFEFFGPLDAAAFESLELPGVAGFRLNAPIDRPDRFDETISFLGASYFRALGRGNRYGLSARGVAINTATSVAEEFPRFTAFYIVRPGPEDERIVIYAELDSASLTGAYAFTVTPGVQTVVDVTKRLYFRQGVERLGIAPLTSMFMHGSNHHSSRPDFRPRVHDSEGLAVVRADGERFWRPLRNPGSLALSYLRETSPRSYGLIQRERSFDEYQDVEARYEARPSLAIEPLSDWGRGTVQLVEIPSNSEANDNVVAFWVPDERPEAGTSYEFRYRMRWGDLAEPEPDTALVSATYGGMGGNSASTGDSPFWRFEVNFSGGTVMALPIDAELEPLVEVSDRAAVRHVGTSRLPDGGIRLSLELEKLDSAPAELRARLAYAGRVVTETWLYQWDGPQ